MAIHLESVAFSFQDRLIFNNLDLTLDKGHTSWENQGLVKAPCSHC